MDDRILREALILARLGLAVHWIRPPHGGEVDGRGKAPVDKAWQHRPWQSPTQLRDRYRPGYNVGIHTGLVVGALPVVAVDFDDARAERWCRENLPPTPLEARTRHGGHLYFLLAGSARCRARVNGLALDIRADGGNIVAPPSVHPERARYEWVNPPGDIGSLPVYRSEWFPDPAPAAASAPLFGTMISNQDTFDRACRYARAIPPAVQGQGGSLATFKLAVALVRGFALPEEDALRVLAQDFNPRCLPPWSEAELRHKVTRAAAAGRVGVGSLLTTAR